MFTSPSPSMNIRVSIQVMSSVLKQLTTTFNALYSVEIRIKKSFNLHIYDLMAFIKVYKKHIITDAVSLM